MAVQMTLPLVPAISEPAGGAEPVGGRALTVGADVRPRARAIPMRRGFRDAVEHHCHRRAVSPDALVAAVLALATPAQLATVADPGAPQGEDITVVWRRTRTGGMRRVREVPSLRLRVGPEVSAEDVRRCLAFALSMAGTDLLRFATREVRAAEATAAAAAAQQEALQAARDAAMAALERLAFKPLDGGIRTPAQAARILGFLSEFGCTPDQVTRRFRELAPVFHPDTGLLACPDRMRQLIEARRMLLDFVRAG